MTQYDRYAEARARRAVRHPSWARAARHGLALLALGALAASLTTAGGAALTTVTVSALEAKVA